MSWALDDLNLEFRRPHVPFQAPAGDYYNVDNGTINATNFAGLAALIQQTNGGTIRGINTATYGFWQQQQQQQQMNALQNAAREDQQRRNHALYQDGAQTWNDLQRAQIPFWRGQR